MKSLVTLTAAVLIAACTAARGDDFTDLTQRHPAAAEFKRLFATSSTTFAPTKLTRKDYLPLIAGNVDFWKHFQSPEGAIVDPYEKKERQYSTPAFALAAAIVVQESDRKDLLDPATRAFSFALTALVNKTTADQHADFYIPMLMHAHRILTKHVDKDTLTTWDNQLRALVPEKTYRDVSGGGNWNLVNVSGELLRRKDKLVADDQLEPQMAYVERCLARQLKQFTKFGMYRDPNAPLAYDAFPRLWLEDTFADNAYAGEHAQKLEEALRLGGLSSLLLISPSGEWPTGGRSGQHQWNEAENAVIAECNANYWNKRNNPAAAGAFKRAARLCLASMQRWQRPTGELWIVKNFADPVRRFGFEGYSFNSQYNLLPAAMLAIAYERADDSIPEFPKPGEYDSYVFDLRDTFHKVVACVQGNYVEIETAADPHYNATGLQRLHRTGVPLSPLSDSVPAHRGYEAAGEKADGGLTPGIQWRDAADKDWHSLADFVSTKDGADPKNPPKDIVTSADLTTNRGESETNPSRRTFTLRYHLQGAGARTVEETYTLTPTSVEVTARLPDGDAPAATRLALPVLVSDGARPTRLQLDGPRVRITRPGATLTYELLSPPNLTLSLEEPKLPMRNGHMQPAVANLPNNTREVRWRATLTPNDEK